MNYRDPFAVVVMRSGVSVGHVPRKISSVCSMFLRRDGTISCRVTGDKSYSEDISQGGLKATCKPTLTEARRNIDKTEMLLVERAFTSDNRADKENEPPKKRCKLSLPESEVNKISSTWLSMNFAQNLLKRQFPGVNGLQSTLLQYKPKTSVSPKDQL